LSQQHIFIVDSDPVAALVTARGLQRLLAPDVQVTTVLSGGGDQLHALREPIDMLVIDPNPQIQEAAALIAALRAARPTMTVLVLAAYDTPGVRKQMQALGVQHYVAKPVEIYQLAATVRALLGMPAALPAQPLTLSPL
jgi:DNA-binding NarL/FixJ family response regulator